MLDIDCMPSNPSENMPVPLVRHPVAVDKVFANAQIPSELITKCIAALLMIQNCTERCGPPSDMAQILDSAITSLHPRSLQNLTIYTEIQRCLGIIKNQIMATNNRVVSLVKLGFC